MFKWCISQIFAIIFMLFINKNFSYCKYMVLTKFVSIFPRFSLDSAYGFKTSLFDSGKAKVFSIPLELLALFM